MQVKKPYNHWCLWLCLRLLSSGSGVRIPAGSPGKTLEPQRLEGFSVAIFVLPCFLYFDVYFGHLRLFCCKSVANFLSHGLTVPQGIAGFWPVWALERALGEALAVPQRKRCCKFATIEQNLLFMPSALPVLFRRFSAFWTADRNGYRPVASCLRCCARQGIGSP